MGSSVLLWLWGVFVFVGSSKKWQLLLEVRLSFGSDPAQYAAFQITQALGSKEAKSTVLDIISARETDGQCFWFKCFSLETATVGSGFQLYL